MSSQCWMSRVHNSANKKASLRRNGPSTNSKFHCTVLKVTTMAALRGESRSKRSKGSNYNKTPNSIIWVKLSILIYRECLERHMNIKLIRHGVFIERIESEGLCVSWTFANASITHLQPSFRSCQCLSVSRNGRYFIPTSALCWIGLSARRSMSPTGLFREETTISIDVTVAFM